MDIFSKLVGQCVRNALHSGVRRSSTWPAVALLRCMHLVSGANEPLANPGKRYHVAATYSHGGDSRGPAPVSPSSGSTARRRCATQVLGRCGALSRAHHRVRQCPNLATAHPYATARPSTEPNERTVGTTACIDVIFRLDTPLVSEQIALMAATEARFARRLCGF